MHFESSSSSVLCLQTCWCIWTGPEWLGWVLNHLELSWKNQKFQFWISSSRTRKDSHVRDEGIWELGNCPLHSREGRRVCESWELWPTRSWRPSRVRVEGRGQVYFTIRVREGVHAFAKGRPGKLSCSRDLCCVHEEYFRAGEILPSRTRGTCRVREEGVSRAGQNALKTGLGHFWVHFFHS